MGMKGGMTVEQFNEMLAAGQFLIRDQLKNGKEYVGFKKYKNKKGYEKLMLCILLDPNVPSRKEDEREWHYLEASEEMNDEGDDEGHKHHFDSKENENIVEIINMFRGLLEKDSITFNEISDETDDFQRFSLEGRYKGEKVAVYVDLYLEDTNLLKLLADVSVNGSYRAGLHPRFVVACNNPEVLDEIFKKIKPNHCDWYD